MNEFYVGEFVVYKGKEIGRVAAVDGSSCFVCYSLGCTSARTDNHLLRPAKDGEINESHYKIGYNRFNDSCPNYDSNCCSHYCANKELF